MISASPKFPVFVRFNEFVGSETCEILIGLGGSPLPPLLKDSFSSLFCFGFFPPTLMAGLIFSSSSPLFFPSSHVPPCSQDDFGFQRARSLSFAPPFFSSASFFFNFTARHLGTLVPCLAAQPFFYRNKPLIPPTAISFFSFSFLTGRIPFVCLVSLYFPVPLNPSDDMAGIACWVFFSFFGFSFFLPSPTGTPSSSHFPALQNLSGAG